MRTDPQYLWDILDAIDSIDSFLADKNEMDFQQSDLLRSAVHAKLLIIGEAVSKLSQNTINKYPQTPWAQIRGLRKCHDSWLLQSELGYRLGDRNKKYSRTSRRR